MSATLIDLTLVNNPDGIYSHEVLEIGILDHNLIYVGKKLAHVRVLKKFNERSFLEELSSISWKYANTFIDPNDSWLV